jgi:penicillin amidase
MGTPDARPPTHYNRRMARPRWVRVLALSVVALLTLMLMSVLGGGLWLRGQLSGSLAILDGEHALPGLSAPVQVERDALGIPTISAASLEDAARALGFVHAQERFFQMDLQRRQPAGELAALVGPAALPVDHDVRRHRFRAVAARALESTPDDVRRQYEAYTEGVNAGLAALDAPPFEYLVLGATPEPWRVEDTFLVGLAMYNDLQNPAAGHEPVMAVMADVLPGPLFEFLAARASDWETPVDGPALAVAPIPDADVFDLRRDGRAAARLTRADHRRLAEKEAWLEEQSALGSNNWALAGSRTPHGSALVANDMHLRIGVPVIWYRASIVTPDPSVPGETLRRTGVTLPGMPFVIVGSNGHIAWGFTNSQADWHDLVIIEPDPHDATRYLTPDGWRAFEVATETIAVRGSASETIDVRWTIWGPVWDTDHHGRTRALRWVAHSPDVIGRAVDRFAFARDTESALALAAGSSAPGQNLVVGDRAGRIGWTLLGTLPRRVGFSGELPVSWADGTNGWQGWLDRGEQPRLIDPPEGLLWSANARVVGGEALAKLGEGNYADGIRARIIKQRLRPIDRAEPADMLAIQLGDEALFLERWRGLLLDVLTGDALAGAPERDEFRRLLHSTWTGRATPESAAYRLARHARAVVSRLAFDPFARLWRDVAPGASYARMRRSEGPLWRLVTERPAHLLDPAYESWEALLVAAIDETIAELTDGGRALRDRTWGEANRAAIGHPLSAAVPLLGRWLDMPRDPLPGDIYTPRASSPRAGASERMAVSPGREEEGILHMPTGQSGHPWSPFYRNQHEAWVHGTPLPLLPGPTAHTLTLTDR